MAETTMPAAEVAVAVTNEHNSYELAFHVLPTVAEGEVASVFETIKAQIIKDGGVMTVEEMPKRIDLAYSIVKPVEGKNRKFASAYFGWVRFTAAPDIIPQLTEEFALMPSILRSLMVKLTRLEEEQPFFYHEMVTAQKKVTVYEEKEAAVEGEGEVAALPETETEEAAAKITE